MVSVRQGMFSGRSRVSPFMSRVSPLMSWVSGFVNISDWRVHCEGRKDNRPKAQENASGPVATGCRLESKWIRVRGARFLDHSQSEVKQNQSTPRLILLEAQLKRTLRVASGTM